MSANIYYRPQMRNGVSVPTSCPSRTLKVIDQLGRTLSTKHLDALKALHENDPSNDAWATLIEGVEKHGIIEVTAEY